MREFFSVYGIVLTLSRFPGKYPFIARGACVCTHPILLKAVSLHGLHGLKPGHIKYRSASEESGISLSPASQDKKRNSGLLKGENKSYRLFESRKFNFLKSLDA